MDSKRTTPRAGGLTPIPLMLLATMALYLTASSLTINRSYHELRLQAFPPQTAGLLDLILMATCLIILLVGLLERSRVIHIYQLAALLFIPSILDRSRVDWPALFGIDGGMALFDSPLTDLDVLLIGCAVLGTFLFHRSAEQALSDRTFLLSLGSSRKDADDTTYHVLLIAAVNILVSVSVIVAMSLSLTVLVPWFDDHLGPHPELVLPIGLMVTVLIMIISKRYLSSRFA